MRSIKVIAKSKDWNGELVNEIDKRFFKDLVFQAMYYQDTVLSVDNFEINGTTLFHYRGKQCGARYMGDVKRATTFLWDKVKFAKTITFKSKFESVEYIIQRENEQSETEMA